MLQLMPSVVLKMIVDCVKERFHLKKFSLVCKQTHEAADENLKKWKYQLTDIYRTFISDAARVFQVDQLTPRKVVIYESEEPNNMLFAELCGESICVCLVDLDELQRTYVRPFLGNTGELAETKGELIAQEQQFLTEETFDQAHHGDRVEFPCSGDEDTALQTAMPIASYHAPVFQAVCAWCDLPWSTRQERRYNLIV